MSKFYVLNLNLKGRKYKLSHSSEDLYHLIVDILYSLDPTMDFCKLSQDYINKNLKCIPEKKPVLRDVTVKVNPRKNGGVQFKKSHLKVVD